MTEILEMPGLPEIWMDGAGNFQVENGILRFVPYSVRTIGSSKTKIGLHRIICKPEAMVMIGAHTRALLRSETVEDMHRIMMTARCH